MSKINLGIDFNSYNTTIYREGKGVVLNEPSKVLCDNVNGEFVLREIGTNAVKRNEDQSIIYPIIEGDIIDEKYAKILLRKFISKVISDKPKANLNAVFSLPCGTKPEQKRKFYYLAYSVGISNIYFVPTPIADIIGCGVSFNDFENCVLVDIGSGTTDIAVLGKSGIISGITLNFGSMSINYAIINQIEEKFGIRITQETAQAVKEQIGSLLPDGTKNLSFTGLDMEMGVTKSVKIASIDIIEPLREFYEFLAQKINMVISNQEEYVIQKILEQGIILCGSGSKIDGIKEFMRNLTHTPVFVANGQRRAFGLGKLFKYPNLLKQYN